MIGKGGSKDKNRQDKQMDRTNFMSETQAADNHIRVEKRRENEGDEHEYSFGENKKKEESK